MLAALTESVSLAPDIKSMGEIAARALASRSDVGVEAMQEVLLFGLLFGRFAASVETNVRSLAAGPSVSGLPFGEAIDFFRSKGVVTPNEFKTLSDTAKRRAFAVAGMVDRYALSEVHDTIDKGLLMGWSQQRIEGNIRERLGNIGIIPPNVHHLDNVVRTNVLGAYAEGRYQQLQRIKKVRPYWRYVTAGDDRVRESHAAMDGKVYPADDSIWDTWTPANGFRCRCSIQGLTVEEFETEHGQISAPPQDKPDPGFRGSPRIEEQTRKATQDHATALSKLSVWQPMTPATSGNKVWQSLGAYEQTPAQRLATWERLAGFKAKDLPASPRLTQISEAWEPAKQGFLEMRLPIRSFLLDTQVQVVQRLMQDEASRAVRRILRPQALADASGSVPSALRVEAGAWGLLTESVLIMRARPREAMRAVAAVALMLQQSSAEPVKHATPAVAAVVRGRGFDADGWVAAYAVKTKQNGRQVTTYSLEAGDEPVMVTREFAETLKQ